MNEQQKQQRLNQPIIPQDKLEPIRLELEQITDEILNSEYTDYSIKNLNQNIKSIQAFNLWNRELEMCQVLGYDYHNQTLEQCQDVQSNIEKCRRLNRIDMLYSINKEQ